MEVIYWTPELEAEIYGDTDPYSDEGVQKFRKWLEDNGVHYYADVKEDFSKNVGIREAETRGLNKVLLDNLS